MHLATKHHTCSPRNPRLFNWEDGDSNVYLWGSRLTLESASTAILIRLFIYAENEESCVANV